MFGFDDNIITTNRISSEMAIKRHPVGFFVAIKAKKMCRKNRIQVLTRKGDIVIDCGNALLKNGYSIRIFNTINFRKSMHYNRATCSPLKRRRTALFLISSVN